MVHIGYLSNLLHLTAPKSKTVTNHTLITLKDHLKPYLCLLFIYYQGHTEKEHLNFLNVAVPLHPTTFKIMLQQKIYFFYQQSITHIPKLNCIPRLHRKS
jgi:hypothetical protein